MSTNDPSRIARFMRPRACPLPRRENLPHRRDRIRLRRRLVLAVALDAGEAEGHPAGVLGTFLDVAEGDLDDQLRADVDGPAVGAEAELLELRGLPGEGLVGQAF